MKVLGIESSCDETGVAVYDTALPGAAGLRAHAVYSQVALLFLLMSVLVFFSHRANIGRLIQGKESRIGVNG